MAEPPGTPPQPDGPFHQPWPGRGAGSTAAYGQVVRTDNKAVAALVLGVGAWVCGGPFLALPGVILGGLSLRDIGRSEGTLTGRPLAITGLIVAGLSLLMFGGILGVLVLGALASG
ncbi:MAG: DUF4190 domain-containing protein [Actinomycetota bacterium]|nr:DUF4190 domain-containing protein [Actinomycetota bacterium]